MITDPPADRPDDESAARIRSPANAPSSEGGIDWPDRSHWSEFDLAIEAGRTGESPEAEQPSEADDDSLSEP